MLFNLFKLSMFSKLVLHDLKILTNLHFYTIHLFILRLFVLTESIFCRKIPFAYIMHIQIKDFYVTFITHD